MGNLQSVLEAFAGKSRELVRCEELCKEIITLIKKDRSKNWNVFRGRSIYRDASPCKELESQLTKIFGVSQTRIYWKAGGYGACSYPASGFTICNRHNTDKQYKTKLHIIIEESSVYYGKLNERELLAVILHEIGHHFYWNPMIVVSEALNVVLCPPLILLRFIAKGIVNIKDELGNFVKQNLPFFYNIMESRNNFITQITRFFPLGIILTNIIQRALQYVTSGVNPIQIIGDFIGGYGGERGADSFAAKYGYGPELVTALKKLRTMEGTIADEIRSNTGIVGQVEMDLISLTAELAAFISLDPHPNDNQRALNTLRKLERDYKEGEYPPEMESDLKAEIERMREIYETIDSNGTNLELRKGWFQVLKVLANGNSDVREIFDVFFKKYEF